MKTSEFITLLSSHDTLGLQFEVEKDYFIPQTFHITEIKNTLIESVDCGGNPDTYRQTVVQLMANPNEENRKPWTTRKALSIFEKVDKTKPINREAEIFFEYGDANIRTSQFSVENTEIADDIINVQLFAKPTVCKPSLVSGTASCC